jgi:hypothetical protein
MLLLHPNKAAFNSPSTLGNRNAWTMADIPWMSIYKVMCHLFFRRVFGIPTFPKVPEWAFHPGHFALEPITSISIQDKDQLNIINIITVSV